MDLLLQVTYDTAILTANSAYAPYNDHAEALQYPKQFEPEDGPREMTMSEEMRQAQPPDEELTEYGNACPTTRSTSAA